MVENDLQTLFEMQAELCRVLGHPVRLQILELLDSRPVPNAAMLDKLSIPKANLSQHLGVLADAGIIRIEKEGVSSVVSLAMPEVKKACRSVREVLQKQLSQELSQKTQIEKLLKKQSKQLTRSPWK